MAHWIAILIILLISSYFDWRFLKIPNAIFPISFFIFIMLSVFFSLPNTLWLHVLTSLAVLIGLFLFWSLGKIFSMSIVGAGDIKLISILPLFLPLKELGLIVGFAFLLMIIFNIFRISKKAFTDSFPTFKLLLFYGLPDIETEKSQTKAPFAPYLLLSTVIVFVFLFFMNEGGLYV